MPPTFYILIVDPSDQDFQKFKEELEKSDRYLKSYGHFSFLHARTLDSALAFIQRYNGAIALTCINPTIAINTRGIVDFSLLRKTESSIFEAIPGDSESVYIGEPNQIDQVKILFNKPSDSHRMISNHPMEDHIKQILDKLNEVSGKRTSGRELVNVQLLKLEQLVSTFDEELESVKSTVNRIQNTLFTSDLSSNTLSLVEIIRYLERNSGQSSQSFDSEVKRLATLFNTDKAQLEDDFNSLSDRYSKLLERVHKIELWRDNQAKSTQRRNALVDHAIQVAITLIIGFLFKSLGII